MTSQAPFGARHPFWGGLLGPVFILIGLTPFLGYYAYGFYAAIELFHYPWIPSIFPAYLWYVGSIPWAVIWVVAGCTIARQS